MAGLKRPKDPVAPIRVDGVDAEVGARIRALREVQGWSQAHLATVTNERAGFGWHQTTVGKIEMGERPLRLVEAFVLSRILYVTLDQLVQGGLEQEMDELIARDHELLRMFDFIQRRRDQLHQSQRRTAEKLLAGDGEGQLSEEARATAEAIMGGETHDQPREKA